MTLDKGEAQYRPKFFKVEDADRDRKDIGPEINLAVESTVSITIIIGEEEEIIITVIITEIIDLIIDPTVGLEIEVMELVIEGMKDMTVGPTIEQTIIGKIMETKGTETEV